METTPLVGKKISKTPKAEGIFISNVKPHGFFPFQITSDYLYIFYQNV